MVGVADGEVAEQPTYKRIQGCIQKNYEFKMHTAYIAEVKRMCGLDMHKALNAVDQRKHEYHTCPLEKVTAIKDALRHFGLIQVKGMILKESLEEKRAETARAVSNFSSEGEAPTQV